MKKISKLESKNKIKRFFENLETKSAKGVKKIKRVAMKQNISLGENRKTFCKKCLTPYKNPKIRIKKKMKVVKCPECYYISRWKLK